MPWIIGQVGLAMSYHLSQFGREHVILEEKWPGHRWRTERWDAFAYPRQRNRDRWTNFAGRRVDEA